MTGTGRRGRQEPLRGDEVISPFRYPAALFGAALLVGLAANTLLAGLIPSGRPIRSLWSMPGSSLLGIR